MQLVETGQALERFQARDTSAGELENDQARQALKRPNARDGSAGEIEPYQPRQAREGSTCATVVRERSRSLRLVRPLRGSNSATRVPESLRVRRLGSL